MANGKTHGPVLPPLLGYATASQYTRINHGENSCTPLSVEMLE